MLSEEFIAKIEGHGNLHIDWNKNEVQLKIEEGERLFEAIVVGRTAEEFHWITPRICGVCPIAHNLASLEAAEMAFGIKVNQTTVILRKLMLAGQIIQSHFLHLFFLALPDYIGIDAGTELNKREPKIFKLALQLKEVSDKIVHAVAGRNIHPTTTAIGGFHKIPDKNELKNLLEMLKKTQIAANQTIKLFEKLNYPKLKVDLELTSQKGDKIISNKNGESLTRDYKKDIEEEIKNYSTAKFGRYKKREVMVGALARLANLDAKKESGLDYQNPFHNNLAQAIEIFLYHEQAQELINQLLSGEMDSSIGVKQEQAPMVGIGAVEAPRGGLYHEIHLDGKGIISYANIITPTVQNLTSIEKSSNALLAQFQNEPKEKKEKLLKMLIRAYDPCITCSVH